VAVFWSVAVPILSFLVGGYIAGRMRSAWEAASSDEVQFRDGMHGMLVWALSIVAGGLLAFLAAGTLANSGAQVTAGALSNRDAVVAPAIDTLFGASVAQAAPAATLAPAAPAATPAPSAVPGTGERAVVPDSDARGVIARTLIAAAAAGELTPAQKRSLAQIVSERTGLSQADAEKRVDQAYKDAVAAIETARKAAVLTGLATATALLAGLLAAWFAAQNGGRHRDENIPARFSLTFAPATRRTPLR
jgi:hypothetical protein